MEKNEIYVVYGQEIIEMAKQLAEACGLAGMIGDKQAKIGLKPNLVVARPADEGATTHPEIAEGLIQYLQANGFKDIAILEGSWVGDSTADAFPVCGYTRLSEEYGVQLVDTQKDDYRVHDCDGMDLSICESALNLDFMINLPVMKGHCQTGITCALKNNKGVIPDVEKRRFHSLGLHKPIAHLNTRVRNDFIVVDGICGDLDFEEGGNPLYAGRLFAAADPVLVDAYAARLMGYSKEEIPHIAIAEELGVGNANLAKAKVVELNKTREGGRAVTPSLRKVTAYLEYIEEDSACSACYAALVRALSRLDRAELQALEQPICIGQGFRGKGGAMGAGICTGRFDSFAGGCPPSASEIIAMVRSKK